MMAKFSVTYEIITPESAADCDVAEDGFVVEGVSLREAIDAVSGIRCESSSYPFRAEDDCWFTWIDPSRDYRTGAEEWRSLHLPRDLTPSTRRRICKVAGRTLLTSNL